MSSTWRDVSCPLTKQLIFGGRRGRSSAVIVEQNWLPQPLRVFFYKFPPCKWAMLKEPMIVGCHSSSRYCHFSLNRNAKAGKLSYYCDVLAATTWNMRFVFAHSFISPQSSKVCFMHRVRLGKVSTLILDISDSVVKNPWMLGFQFCRLYESTSSETKDTSKPIPVWMDRVLLEMLHFDFERGRSHRQVQLSRKWVHFCRWWFSLAMVDPLSASVRSYCTGWGRNKLLTELIVLYILSSHYEALRNSGGCFLLRQFFKEFGKLCSHQ